MEKDPQLKLFTNIPVIVTLDKFIKSGSGQYGEWNLWSVLVDGVKHTFFPTPAVHQQLESFTNGAVLKLEKKEIEGGKTKITVESMAPGFDKPAGSKVSTPSFANEVPIQDTILKAPGNQTQAKREFSIITQSLLHIPGYYKPGQEFADNAARAIDDAKLFINIINEVEL